MKFSRPLRWAIAMILALVCAAGAQITNTASVEFLTKTFSSPNIVGAPLVTATRWFNMDSLPIMTVRAVVADTTDSTHVDLNVTITYGPLIASKNFTDVRTDAEFWLPDTTWDPGIPDSLFSIVLLDTRPLVPGEEFKLEIKEAKAQINAEGRQKVIATESSLFKDWD